MRANRFAIVPGTMLVGLLLIWAQDGMAFYNAQTGRWPNRDPIGELGGLNLYSLAANDEINKVDMDGRITVTEVPGSRKQGNCGAYSIAFAFSLDNANPPDGFIVQELTDRERTKGCLDSKYNTFTSVVWEYFPVDSSHKALDPCYQISSNGKGAIADVGEIKFFSKSKVGDLTTAPGWHQSSGGGYTDVPPIWWNDPSDNEEKTGHRAVSTSWDCCCKPYFSQFHADP